MDKFYIKLYDTEYNAESGHSTVTNFVIFEVMANAYGTACMVANRMRRQLGFDYSDASSEAFE